MINWGRIEELQNEIGADDFAEVAQLFMEETDDVMARLGKSASATALCADFHFLKGAALNLGLDALAALCQTAEQRSAAGSMDIDLDEVRLIYNQSRQALEAGIARDSAA